MSISYARLNWLKTIPFVVTHKLEFTPSRVSSSTHCNQGAVGVGSLFAILETIRNFGQVMSCSLLWTMTVEENGFPLFGLFLFMVPQRTARWHLPQTCLDYKVTNSFKTCNKDQSSSHILFSFLLFSVNSGEPTPLLDLRITLLGEAGRRSMQLTTLSEDSMLCLQSSSCQLQSIDPWEGRRLHITES